MEHVANVQLDLLLIVKHVMTDGIYKEIRVLFVIQVVRNVQVHQMMHVNNVPLVSITKMIFV